MEKLKVFGIIDENAEAQIKTFMEQDCMKKNIFRIMPDVHSSKGSVVGMTIKLNEKKVIPNLIGSDIGCGVSVYKFTNKIELQELDKFIHSIATKNDMIVDYDINGKPHKDRIGSLGGGNHFIEVDKDSEGNFYLVIHSGSRIIGEKVNKYYQELAYEKCNHDLSFYLSYLEKDDFYNYINDVDRVVKIAKLNRDNLASQIMKKMKLKVVDKFESIHNYIDSDLILRKGAVSAKKGEKLIIPINMKDGSLICTGKGNKEWNYSAPHGAGRSIPRSEVKNIITLNELKKDMKGIYTTSLNKDTLDESPIAYKSLEYITDIISHGYFIENATVDIDEMIYPIYNYKN